MAKDIRGEYFNWLCDIVFNPDTPAKGAYDDLMHYLHEVIFTYSNEYDSNRAADGEDLRRRFCSERGYLNGELEQIDECECSVLEMLIALSLRCEETIMDDPEYGNRTGHWFWVMIENLDLDLEEDGSFDMDFAEDRLSIWMDREYEKNGRGGLFIINDPNKDMRRAEIWYQMLWYLDELLY